MNDEIKNILARVERMDDTEASRIAQELHSVIHRAIGAAFMEGVKEGQQEGVEHAEQLKEANEVPRVFVDSPSELVLEISGPLTEFKSNIFGSDDTAVVFKSTQLGRITIKVLGNSRELLEQRLAYAKKFYPHLTFTEVIY